MKKQFFIKNLSIVLILALCIPFCSCGGSSSDDSASGEFSVDIVSDASNDGKTSVDASADGDNSVDSSVDGETSVDTSSDGDTSVDTSVNEDISVDTSADSDTSVETSVDDDISVDTSADSDNSVETSDNSQNTSEENLNWTPEVTYYADTGKCTYNTIYSPVVNDNITYSNNGINLYNTDFRMSKELESAFLTLFGSFSKPQSVTVREIGTEFVFSYCPDTRIACASAIKGPFSLFLTKCLEQGLVSWNEKLEYAEKYDYFVGSGVIQENYPYGTKFSVKRLYELMLNVSDNIAYLMLKDRVKGAKYFNDMVNSLGCADIISSGNWGHLTSYEMALIWREIYHYVTVSKSTYAEKLYKELYNAKYNELWKAIPRCENLHKSGWSANGYNDAGVLFDGEQNYVVAIMTGRTKLNDSENARHLTKIAKLVDKLMIEYNAYLAEAKGAE